MATIHPPSNIPIPDPSDLTIKHLDKLEETLRKEFAENMVCHEKFMEERVKRIDEKIGALKELSVELDKANKEAVIKSETAFQKDIDGLKEVSRLDRTTFDQHIATLTDRLSRSEASTLAIKESKTENNMTIGSISSVILGIVGVISLVISIILAVHSYAPTANNLLAANPTVGADTKRVDDLISTIQTQDRDINDRINALSNRMNSIPPTITDVPISPPFRGPTTTK